MAGPAFDLGVEDGGPPPVFSGIFMGLFAIRHIIVLADILSQPIIHQNVGFIAKFLAPGAVFGL